LSYNTHNTIQTVWFCFLFNRPISSARSAQPFRRNSSYSSRQHFDSFICPSLGY